MTGSKLLQKPNNSWTPPVIAVDLYSDLPIRLKWRLFQRIGKIPYRLEIRTMNDT